MKLPKLKIRKLESEFPVIQAGMGVRVGNYKLAAETALQGGFGTIASVGLGDVEKSKNNFVEESNKHLALQIQKARELSGGKGPVGVNVMVALSNYGEIVQESVRQNVDFILSGAGLPLNLPEYVGDADIALIPIISSARALKIVLKTWKRKYKRMPDAIVIEGPECGGHLGFSMKELEKPEELSLKILYKQCRKVLDEFNYDIPMIAAGEVASKKDIEKALSIGYSGVQIGTKFIVSEESGIDRKSKEVFINASADDVVLIKSPVGLPVRVLNTPLVQRVSKDRKEQFSCPYRCLRSCRPYKVRFCIAKALLATWRGDTENGLFMCGSNIDALDEIYPLKKFFDTLKN